MVSQLTDRLLLEWQSLGYDRRARWLMVGLSSAMAIFMLAPTLYMLQVFDRVLLSQNLLTLVWVSLITLYLLLWLAVFDWFRLRLSVWLGARYIEHSSGHLFDGLASRYLQPGLASRSAATQTLSDLQEVRQYLFSPNFLLLFDAPFALVFLLAVFLLHPLMGLLAMVFIAVQVAWVMRVYRRVSASPLPARLRECIEREAKFTSPRLAAVEVIEPLGMGGRFLSQMSQLRADERGLALQQTADVAALASTGKAIRYIQQAISLGAAALLVIAGEMSPGSMIAANVLIMRALAPIDALASGLKPLLGFLESKSRLDDLKSDSEAVSLSINRPSSGNQLAIADADFRLEAISVKFGSHQRLAPITLQVPRGSIALVMGPSGSGKSLLLKAIVGVLPAQCVEGRVAWGGVLDLAQLDESLRFETVGYLGQDVELFSGSVAENIARMSTVDSTKVLDAAMRAGLHELILKLPKGYETQVGESGAILPGGIRQRIGLARAFYGNPTLLVLDEPDANLDDLGLMALDRALIDARASGAIVWVASHREALRKIADRVIEMPMNPQPQKLETT